MEVKRVYTSKVSFSMEKTMKIFVALVFVFLVSPVVFTQETSREQKFKQIKELNAQIDKVVQDLLLPSTADIKAAEAEGLTVFRLMPREVFGRAIAVPREGGSYYSFATGSHDYGSVSQISLEQKSLKTGFAGADYGLMGDLGSIPVSDVAIGQQEIDFLLKYKPPSNVLDAQAEKRKSQEYNTGEFILRSRFPVKIGNTYVLRAIEFGKADVLVGFKVVRQDTDGSLIIFWKQIADFGKPQLEPSIRGN